MKAKKVDIKMHHPIIRIKHKDGTVEEHRAKAVYYYRDPEALARFLKAKQKQKEGKNG